MQAGKLDEAVRLIAAQRDGTDVDIEISSAYWGQHDRLVLDFSAPSLADLDRAWADWSASERAGPFFQQWVQLVEAGGTNEVWEVR